MTREMSGCYGKSGSVSYFFHFQFSLKLGSDEKKKGSGTFKRGFNIVMDEVEPFDLFYRKK